MRSAPGSPAIRETPEAEQTLSLEVREAANALLGRVGMRLMNPDGVVTVGLWRDTDTPEVRAAIAVFHPGGIPVQYLDDPDIPARYKTGRPPSLKSQAVELWSENAGSRVFIVADEEDAQEAMKRLGASRGEVWTPDEIELVARIEDQAIRDEIAAYKRQMDGRLNETGP